MDSPAIQRCLKDIRKRRKDLRLIPPPDVVIDYSDPTSLLGEGGFCSAYRATYNDQTVCARVIDEDREVNRGRRSGDDFKLTGNRGEDIRVHVDAKARADVR